MRTLNDKVTFTKKGTKITGVISEFFYDKHKNTIVAVREGTKLHFVLESELD